MTGNVNVPLYMNPTSAPQQQQALQMMRAQLLAQQFQQSGQMPADNEMAGNVVVRHSPLEYLSRQVSQNMGTQEQLKAAQMQMQLMGQNMGGSGAAGSNGTGTGIDPSQLRKAAMYDQMYGAGSGKAYLDSIQPTPDQKNASASGSPTPLDYNNQNSLNTAKANAGMKTSTHIMPDGKAYDMTDAQYAAALSSSQPSPQAQQQLPNGAAIPPVAPVTSTPLPPPTGFSQAGGAIPPIAAGVPNQPSNPARGSLTASEAAIPTPPQEANVTTGGSIGGMPLSGDANTRLANAVTAQNTPVPYSQMVQNSAPNVGGGMQVQSPAQAEAAKAAALSPITAKTAGDTKAQENYQTYRQGLNTMTSNLGKEVGIANAQDDFINFTNGRGGFKPGLGETGFAQAAAAAASAGAGPALQASIARGDPGAVQAFNGLASQESVRQMEGMMANGNSNPRITQNMFDNFKADLSNPDKQANAIDAIHNMMRLQYKNTYDEQQAALADKGDPTTFQERYQATKYPTLMNGRGADPSAAIQKGSVQSQIPPTGAQQVGTKGGKPVYKLPDGRGWMPD